MDINITSLAAVMAYPTFPAGLLTQQQQQVDDAVSRITAYMYGICAAIMTVIGVLVYVAKTARKAATAVKGLVASTPAHRDASNGDLSDMSDTARETVNNLQEPTTE